MLRHGVRGLLVDVDVDVESADLGEESSGSYLLCFSCSFLLLVSASLSTFCNSLAWQ